MDFEDIAFLLIILTLNIVGFVIGYCYGTGNIVKVNEDCVIYKETLYCEVENTLRVDFGQVAK